MITRARIAAAIVISLTLLLFALPVQAHPLNNGYSQITIENRNVDYELSIPEPSLIGVFDLNKDNVLTVDELNSERAAIEDYLHKHLELEVPAGLLEMQLGDMSKTDKSGIPAISFQLRFTAKTTVDSLNIRYNLLFDDADPLHLNFMVITNGGDVDQTVFDANNRNYHYQSMVQTGPFHSAFKYLLLGVEHIVTGYDHLVFLLSLILVASRLRDIIKIVTAFTIAHSITLFLAATGHISVDSRWIESGIALTIAYVAIENMFVRSVRLRWLVTFLFGLIHGMGFAGAISEVGLPEEYMVSSLLSFNLGVEAGQLAIVLLVMPYLLKLQRTRHYRTIVLAVSGCVVLLALYWFIQRI
ncbi:HupE/UreJ family protein [Paenibacillus thalictri]|uniref:HupE/UreJ family protein n=1 Tax=Paenibacillus thalictri TaxID=2527873 RepID=UPI0013EF0FD8|nr:HupE/UreJ family protein [Paenibacillus thalictri]